MAIRVYIAAARSPPSSIDLRTEIDVDQSVLGECRTCFVDRLRQSWSASGNGRHFNAQKSGGAGSDREEEVHEGYPGDTCGSQLDRCHWSVSDSASRRRPQQHHSLHIGSNRGTLACNVVNVAHKTLTITISIIDGSGHPLFVSDPTPTPPRVEFSQDYGKLTDTNEGYCVFRSPVPAIGMMCGRFWLAPGSQADNRAPDGITFPFFATRVLEAH